MFHNTFSSASTTESLIRQIADHLSHGTYTADQLASMTGASHYQVIDALTYLIGTDRVEQDTAPRYRIIKPGTLAGGASQEAHPVVSLLQVP